MKSDDLQIEKALKIGGNSKQSYVPQNLLLENLDYEYIDEYIKNHVQPFADSFWAARERF